MAKTLSDQVVDILIDAGLTHAYGVPGDAMDLILASIHKRDDFKFYLTRHEEGAGFMASAYAKLTGKMGVVLACQGPGAAHMLEAMYDAKLDKVPMLVITGQIESARIGTNTVQEINQLMLFADVAAFNREVRSANNLVDTLQLAIQTALSQRIVAHVSIATDVLREPVVKRMPNTAVYDMPYHILPDDSLIEKAAAILNEHENITILYGDGARHATEELLNVAQLLSAPLVHTVRSKDIIDNHHPHYAGGIGMKGSKNGCHFVKDCDALLIVGSSFAWREYYPEHAPIIQIDTNPQRLGIRSSISVGMIGDAGLSLALLSTHLKQKSTSTFLQESQQAHQHAIDALEAHAANYNRHYISATTLTHVISKHLAQDAIVTLDAGTVSIWANNWLRLNGTQRLIASGELGTLGFGMPAALGCKLEAPQRQVVALCGDGGFQMTLGEFSTAIKYNLPIVVFIFNNHAYRFIELEQMKEGVAQCYTKLTNPDYAKLAEAFGGVGFTIKNSEELESVVQQALSCGRPCLVDVHVDPDELFVPSTVTLSMAANFVMGMVKTRFSRNK